MGLTGWNKVVRPKPVYTLEALRSLNVVLIAKKVSRLLSSTWCALPKPKGAKPLSNATQAPAKQIETNIEAIHV
jgi:hypothetical protein